MRLTPLHGWIAQKIGCLPVSLTLGRLRAYQLQQVQETLHLARARSPFYRRHLAAAPAELSTLADLRRFPFTTPEDIRQQPLQFLCVSQGEIERVVTLQTSGTTGPLKRLYFTQADQELTLDFFHFGMATFTDPGDRVLILLPGERPGRVGDLLATALARLGAVGLKHGPGWSPAETLGIMAKTRASGLVGAPVQVLALARQPNSSSLRLKSVLLTTDHVPQAIVKAIERAWGCEVYNHYGMTEMGLGGGVECRARRGYHLREADLYVEIVDPVSGDPRPAGEAGEIVFTTLTRRGMPLIRYRTGDVSRFIPGDCPCGTVLPTLERVRYRLDGQAPAGFGQQLTMADLDEALFARPEVLDFSASLERASDKSILRIEVNLTDYEANNDLATLQQAVETVPAIQPAVLAGSLQVAISMRKGGDTAGQTRMSKRVITWG